MTDALRAAMLAQIDGELSRRRLELYTPYRKQLEFHALGASTRERLFMAGNQLGKSLSGAAEMAVHLTGRYPEWWEGRVFTKPVAAWASGVTGESVRDTVQRLLVGRPGQYGTGFIPADCIVGEPRRAMGVSDLLDSVAVRHSSGGESRLYFKRYEQGREKWQGETLDIVWFDEEPPSDIYTEGLTRTNATGGMAYMTFTPLLGMSEVVTRFITESSPDRSVTNMTIDDVDHYSDEEKRRIIESYPAHEREARAKGIPTLGSGRIFPIEDSAISIAPFPVPAHWPRINGLDFGWDHPTAAVQLAWDRDADCIYVHKAHRMREAAPVIHAATVKAWGAWVPTAWPHDGLQHDKGSGEQLAKQYAATGLLMLKERATFDDGSNGVEAGLMDMLERMQTGRFKVFSNLDDWFQEFRMYHRKDGKVVKKVDDLMCLHPDTQVLTSSGLKKIEELVGTSGEVVSVGGEVVPYLNCRMTRQDAEMVKVVFDDGFELLCTPDHKLLCTDGSWVQAIDSEGVSIHNAVSSSERHLWTKSGLKASGSPSLATTGAVQGSSCMGRYGNHITDQLQKAITFITLMVTAKTTIFPTLNASLAASTYPTITPGTHVGQTLQSKPGLSGVRPKKESPSCLKWVGAIKSSCARIVSLFANAVQSNSSRGTLEEIASVLGHAKRNIVDTVALTKSNVLASNVGLYLRLKSSGHHYVAPRDAGEKCGFQHLKAKSISKILRVESAVRSDVYCMEVPSLHAFAIANGVVVHNCATRYALMMKRKAKVRPMETQRAAAWVALDKEVGW